MHMAMALAREGGREGEGGGGNGGGERREHMFEKVVTPSDVGKLNRLVVPKHFAEKYFPLGPAAAGPAGTMLCFEDACGGGRLWRFRYSYWSSSQSYVMTKGWSRFVREKRLAAGDTVFFCRAGTRLFIDWLPRARAAALAAPTAPPRAHAGCLRLFGVDVELHGEAAPVLLDLQL